MRPIEVGITTGHVFLKQLIDAGDAPQGFSLVKLDTDATKPLNVNITLPMTLDDLVEKIATYQCRA